MNISLLHIMKKYQGIDISRPETYFGDFNIVHKSFNLKKRIVDTVETKEISNDVVEKAKQLRITNKQN